MASVSSISTTPALEAAEAAEGLMGLPLPKDGLVADLEDQFTDPFMAFLGSFNQEPTAPTNMAGPMADHPQDNKITEPAETKIDESDAAPSVTLPILLNIPPAQAKSPETSGAPFSKSPIAQPKNPKALNENEEATSRAIQVKAETESAPLNPEEADRANKTRKPVAKLGAENPETAAKDPKTLTLAPKQSVPEKKPEAPKAQLTAKESPSSKEPQKPAAPETQKPPSAEKALLEKALAKTAPVKILKTTKSTQESPSAPPSFLKEPPLVTRVSSPSAAASPKLLIQQVTTALHSFAASPTDGVQIMTLQLVPRSLGKISITISVADNNASLHFEGSVHAITALAENQQSLRQDLENQGWNLDKEAFQFSQQSGNSDRQGDGHESARDEASKASAPVKAGPFSKIKNLFFPKRKGVFA